MPNGDEVIHVEQVGAALMVTRRDSDGVEYVEVMFPEEGEGEEKQCLE